MTTDTINMELSGPLAGQASAPGRQERLINALAPTIFCPHSKLDACLRTHGQGEAGR
jgi:hypothetical protein